MSGENNLDQLLRHMQPVLNEGTYVFCTVTDNNLKQLDRNDILFSFREKEGTTVVLPQHIAAAVNLPYTFPSCWITLTVHSSLEAVGLTAAFSTALAQAGISCNVVAAYYHDHIFVPKQDAQRAMEVLQSFSS